MSRTPTPADVVNLFPATTLPVPGTDLAELPTTPSPAATEVVHANAMLDAIDDAVTHALAHHDPRAYFQALAKQKPDLFFKYVALVVQNKSMTAGARTANIIAPLGRSTLDGPPG